MEISGRLVRNAAVKTTNAGKELVSFSIAINDSYKAKGSSEVTKTVTYVECAYWRSTAIAPFLTKGTIVTVSGRPGVNAWKGMDGEAHGQLTCNVNDIRLLGGGAKGNGTAAGKGKAKQEATPTVAAENDDLPF